MSNYSKHFNSNKTPQNEPIPGRDMVQNAAGGFNFAVDDWARLRRFLILGTEGGSFHQKEQKLTKENAQAVLRCIKTDGPRAVKEIVTISVEGRAPKNDPAIFALAMALKLGDEATRRLASDAVPEVCRIGTHVFQLAEAVKAFGGWGRTTARAFANWYNKQTPDKLALNLLKYQQRDGWSHKNLLSKSHAGGSAPTKSHAAMFSYVMRNGDLSARKVERKVKGKVLSVGDYSGHSRADLPRLIEGFEKVREDGLTEKMVAKLIRDYDLPREVVPTQFLNSKDVWDALLHAGKFGMPIGALVRNLSKMTTIGLIAPLSDATSFVASKLDSEEAIKHGRMHPLSILLASRTYAQGHGEKGSLQWKPVPQVLEALDKAFYHGFKSVEPTGLKHLIAVDVSGSMHSSRVAGGLVTSAEAAAAVALVTANVEKNHHMVCFTNGSQGAGEYKFGTGASRWSQVNSGISPLDINPRMRLSEVAAKTRNMPFGGTDCALPMLYALKNKIEVDVFMVLTDNETWANKEVHPSQALKLYRQEMQRPAKLVVLAFEASNNTIADPNDSGMIDIVGLDTSTPDLISAFVRA